MADRLAEANVEKYEQSIKEQAEELSVSAEKIEALTTELETVKTSVSELTTSLEEMTTDRNSLGSKISEMEASEKIRSRRSLLSSAGFSDEEIEAKMETFGDLTDEQFAALAQTLATYVAETQTKVDDSDDTAAEIVAEEVVTEAAESEVVEAAEEVVDTEVLETVEAEEASTLSVASDASVGSDDGIEIVRAGLQDWVSTVVLNTNNSKSGE